MHEEDVLLAQLLDEACLSLEQLAAACAVEPGWIVHRVEEGLMPAPAGNRDEWRFSRALLLRARRMCRVERDFDAVPELAALVADLEEELDRLRAHLRMAGLR